MSYSPREPIWILKYEVASLLANYSFAPKSCEGPVHPLARGPHHCSEVLLAKRIPDNDTLARKARVKARSQAGEIQQRQAYHPDAGGAVPLSLLY